MKIVLNLIILLKNRSYKWTYDIFIKKTLFVHTFHATRTIRPNKDNHLNTLNKTLHCFGLQNISIIIDRKFMNEKCSTPSTIICSETSGEIEGKFFEQKCSICCFCLHISFHLEYDVNDWEQLKATLHPHCLSVNR